MAHNVRRYETLFCEIRFLFAFASLSKRASTSSVGLPVCNRWFRKWFIPTIASRCSKSSRNKYRLSRFKAFASFDPIVAEEGELVECAKNNCYNIWKWNMCPLPMYVRQIRYKHSDHWKSLEKPMFFGVFSFCFLPCFWEKVHKKGTQNAVYPMFLPILSMPERERDYLRPWACQGILLDTLPCGVYVFLPPLPGNPLKYRQAIKRLFWKIRNRQKVFFQK